MDENSAPTQIPRNSDNTAQNTFLEPQGSAESSVKNKTLSFKSIIINISLLCIGFIIVLGIILFLFPQIWKVPVTKMILSGDIGKSAYIQIKQRDITTNNFLETPSILINTIQFKTPWGEPIRVAPAVTKGTDYFFLNNKSITITDASFKLDYQSELTKKNPDSQEIFEKKYSTEAWKNNLQMKKIIVNTTPSDLSIMEPKDLAFLKADLLIFKLASIPPAAETGIYEYSSNGNTAIQYGDPSKAKKIMVEIYNIQGASRTIVTNGATQEEIDFIVSNIQIM